MAWNKIKTYLITGGLLFAPFLIQSNAFAQCCAPASGAMLAVVATCNAVTGSSTAAQDACDYYSANMGITGLGSGTGGCSWTCGGTGSTTPSSPSGCCLGLNASSSGTCSSVSSLNSCVSGNNVYTGCYWDVNSAHCRGGSDTGTGTGTGVATGLGCCAASANYPMDVSYCSSINSLIGGGAPLLGIETKCLNPPHHCTWDTTIPGCGLDTGTGTGTGTGVATGPNCCNCDPLAPFGITTKAECLALTGTSAPPAGSGNVYACGWDSSNPACAGTGTTTGPCPDGFRLDPTTGSCCEGTTVISNTGTGTGTGVGTGACCTSVVSPTDPLCASLNPPSGSTLATILGFEGKCHEDSNCAWNISATGCGGGTATGPCPDGFTLNPETGSCCEGTTVISNTGTGTGVGTGAGCCKAYGYDTVAQALGCTALNPPSGSSPAVILGFETKCNEYGISATATSRALCFWDPSCGGGTGTGTATGPCPDGFTLDPSTGSCCEGKNSGVTVTTSDTGTSASGACPLALQGLGGWSWDSLTNSCCKVVKVSIVHGLNTTTSATTATTRVAVPPKVSTSTSTITKATPTATPRPTSTPNPTSTPVETPKPTPSSTPVIKATPTATPKVSPTATPVNGTPPNPNAVTFNDRTITQLLGGLV